MHKTHMSVFFFHRQPNWHAALLRFVAIWTYFVIRFDDSGEMIVQAFFPSDERAQKHSPTLLQKAWTFCGLPMHELGHALGIHHSSVDGVIMFPYYDGYVPMKLY